MSPPYFEVVSDMPLEFDSKSSVPIHGANSLHLHTSRKQELGLPNVVLFGTGVVGRAILKAHISAGVSVCIADQNDDSMHSAVAEMANGKLMDGSWKVSPVQVGGCSLLSLTSSDFVGTTDPVFVIESIPERLDVKQTFFREAEQMFGADAILCSNTSTLRIEDIASSTSCPKRVCGMHFFMPVDQRSAVEIVRTDTTSPRTIATCLSHAQRIHKTPLVVRDHTGFVVNRILSPYLNQALMLLAHGVPADQIENAAIEYGMPFSPLELIDWIGTRTMFDAGRAFWQAFPTRIDPSPIVPALIKKKRSGRALGAGLYDYESGVRSKRLSQQTLKIIEKYQIDRIEWTHADLVHLLAIPMWIEACLAIQDGVVDRPNDFNIAMSGGLGYRSAANWIEFFRTMGLAKIDRAIQRWGDRFRSMSRPSDLDLGSLLK